MHLVEALRPEMFWPGLNSNTKPEVINELSENISSIVPSLDAAKVAEILMDRERLGSTGIQDGIAIPHGKVPGLDKIVVACGTKPSGIEFDSHDGKPAQIFFVLLAPEFAAGHHLKVLARLSRLLKEEHIRKALLDASDGSEMYKLLVDEDKNI